MSGLVVTNAQVVTPAGVHAPGWLATAGTAISACGSGEPSAGLRSAREPIDAAGATLLPGFVDVHIHGAVGHDVMDADPDGLRALARFAARHGATAVLATTWTAGRAATLAALRSVAVAMREPTADGARIVGAHLEGPYLNPRRCGAQDPDHIRGYDPEEAAAFVDTGVVRLVTLAPEIEANRAWIPVAVRAGITVGLGHSDATLADADAAVAAGARHVTHTFNAMRGLHHREPGLAGAALLRSELVAELVADGVHVHPEVMRLLVQAKGPDGVALVTDATRAAGLPEGPGQVGGRSVRVRDGAARLADGTLVGSVATMDTGLRHLVAATGRPATELWPATSRTPARAAGIAGRTAALVPGRDADLVLVDDAGEVRLTVVAGAVAHRRGV